MAVALMACAVLPATGSAALSKGRCPAPSFFEELGSIDLPPDRSGCALLTVPLDHTGATAGNLSLEVRRMPATKKKGKKTKARGTLVFLLGGPGQSSVGSGFIRALEQIAPGWNSIVLDQRGTGKGALRCTELEKGPSPDAIDAQAAALTKAFSACAQQLGPNRRFFSSVDSARDIERLRADLGVPKIAIGGISYGTHVAQVYARMFPDKVDRLLLDSVVGPQGMDSIDYASYQATRRMMRDQCAGRLCEGVTSDLAADVNRLQAKLDAAPLAGTVTNPKTGKPENAKLDSSTLFSMYAAGDLDDDLRRYFPPAVQAALAGDAAPMLRVAALAPDLDYEPSELSLGLLAATTCAERRFPWSAGQSATERRAAIDSELTAQPDSAFYPFTRNAATQSLPLLGCVEWPDSPSSAAPTGPLPNVPALLLSGSLDTRTPAEQAGAVAAQLPQAKNMVMAGTGHSALGSVCGAKMAIAFLANKPVNGCKQDRFSREAGLGSWWPIARSLNELKPVGAAGPAGLTIAGVRATMEDAVAYAPSFEDVVPGLRGGLERIDLGGREETFRFSNFSYIPGLEISGKLTEIGTSGEYRGTLKVGGSAAASGVLKLKRKRRVTGNLGGTPINWKYRKYDLPLL